MKSKASVAAAGTVLSTAFLLGLMWVLGMTPSHADRKGSPRGAEATLLQPDPDPAAEDPFFGRDSSYFFWTRNRQVHAQPRPTGLSPLGDSFLRAEPPLPDRGGLVSTPLGFVDLRGGRGLERVPPGLLVKGTQARAGRGEVAPGVNVVQVEAAALESQGLASVEAALRRTGRVIATLPERAFVVRAENGGGLERLAALPFIEGMMPYHPALKIDPLLGRIPLIQASRARSNVLDVMVQAWPGADAAELEDLRRAVEQVAGRAGVEDYSGDGTVLRVGVTPAQVTALATVQEVSALQEVPEFMLSNAEAPSLLMTGSVQDTQGARPYQDIGVDGGGLNSAGQPTGTRVNNGTAQVPPQVVTVTDNGISVDSAQFSQTATAVETGAAPIGPSHRKVHAIQAVADTGNSCDGVLSGSSTHGNIVAGAIAGWPSAVGAFATKTIGVGNPTISGISMDGVARGARIIMQDCAAVNRCLIDELVEDGGSLTPGNIATRLKDGRDGSTNAHLQVLPFGVPNFDNVLNNAQNGTYTMEANQIDTFLVNNRDYMVFSPVGNQGSSPATQGRRYYPDLFDGTALDNDPNFPQPIQIAPPATAKDSVTVGAHREDMQTFAGTFIKTAKQILTVGGRSVDQQSFTGTFNEEEVPTAWSSRGPATPTSLRTAPIVMSVGEDFNGIFGAPGVGSVAVFRSRDNDNLPPVEAVLDEQNSGTSYASAYATGAGAIVRDYFAQGFYPTGSRVTANRMGNISGALVKAALVAGANFLEESGIVDFPTTADKQVGQSRSVNLPGPGVIGNSEQGYGRVQLSTVLPIPNWTPAKPIGAPDTLEYPAQGLLVYDDIGTGDLPINNTTRTLVTRTFSVDSANTLTLAGGGRAVAVGSLRVALAWPDPPDAANSGGLLINDLDLEVESPGPDNDINTTGDNVVYDGNVYILGQGPRLGQWSLGRTTAAPDVSDRRNPVEAVHLTADPNGDRSAADSMLYTGTWKVRVKRGVGGAVPGMISRIDGPNEDTNGNFRLDTGEDTDGDGLLDAAGQPYALVIAGPVLGTGTQTWASTTHAFPTSQTRFDKSTYGCSDDVVLQIFDPGASLGTIGSLVTLSVQDASGVVYDTERYFSFTENPVGSHGFYSVPVPVRLASPAAISNNGLLEADTGLFIVADYQNATAAVQARATMRCDPSLYTGILQVPNEPDGTSVFSGGCDRDQYPDSDENLTYTIALINSSPGDDYADVTATLTPSGPGAAAIKVLDSPKGVGRLPPGQQTGIGFSIHVDGAAVNALSVANRKVTLTLTLDSTSRDKVLGRQSFSFTHALSSDREVFHYSTDFPAGGREVRDLNRNGQVDHAGLVNPVTRLGIPDEDITFSSLFYSDGGVIRNLVGEDLNRNGVLDSGEDIIPDNKLDCPALCKVCVGGTNDGKVCVADNGCFPDGLCVEKDRVPWSFDLNDGGFTAFRHAASDAGTIGVMPFWEYRTLGLCGFQTAIPDGDSAVLFQNDGAGIWHTGDGDPFTPDELSLSCDNYLVPQNPATPPQAEAALDVLQSSIVAKVHQNPDARGFPYTVEFQRLGMNLNHQTPDGFAGGFVNLDSDIDSDERNCLLCQPFSPRFGGAYYVLARLYTYSYGVDPTGRGEVKQRTFGPRIDPNNSIAGSGTVTGDETGFTGFTANTNVNSSSPIPTAPPDLLPYPLPTATLPLASDGHPVDRRTAGPTRNFDLSLVNYEDGVTIFETGPGAFELAQLFNPGPAGNRFMLGVGFFTIENNSLQGDYGIGVDDPVLEWNEVHPVDEGQFSPPHTPACQRFGQPGQAAGQQCATLVVDRTILYECDEAIGVTVNDPKRAGAGTILVQAASESDGKQVGTGLVSVNEPVKSFPLQEVATTPGLFKGTITVTSQFNNPGTLFVTPSTDQTITVYYVDTQCDGNANGQAGQATFENIDGDSVPATGFAAPCTGGATTGCNDNCPTRYNPMQQDADGDGVGDICDNCPAVPNASQTDTDADGVGDACELTDGDMDGVLDAGDNCPDVYNPQQIAGTGAHGQACSQTGDRDGDGVPDNIDNCVRTPNGPAQGNSQRDSDADGIGDACDKDCVGATTANLATGVCDNSETTICTSSANCPGGAACRRQGIVNSGSCSAYDDDFDVDGVPNLVDDCPTIYNPAIIPDTFRQQDTDLDGLGDVCDPAGSWDDDNNGIPDDILSYSVQVNCRALPLARLLIVGTEVGDTNGDRDIFPDSGETARLYLTVQNISGIDLTNVNLNLNAVDPNIACITRPSIFRSAFHAGETLVLGSIGPDKIAGTADDTGDFYEFITKPTLQSPAGSGPVYLDLVLTLTSSEIRGTGSETLVHIPADLDKPPGTVQQKVVGPDGISGTADDGVVFENFDTERDGFAGISVGQKPLGAPGAHNDTIGVVVRSGKGGVNTLSAVGCGGYNIPPVDPECRIDPDNDMAWHIHCPPGTCQNATNFVTPLDGALAFSGANSLHWGHHLDPTSRKGDTTRFRQIAAFMTNPINLALFPDPGDLRLSFFHIASMISNNELNIAKPEAFDFGDVQIQVDRNPDPAVDDWGFWDKLVPYQNVYDHTPEIWSHFGSGVTYCVFTPRDTGGAAPAPHGVHETMCWPMGVWSNCGWQYDTTSTLQCPGPAFPGATGSAAWVQTKFDLANFLGQRVRIRWIAQSWEFNSAASSYQELGGEWSDLPDDDGWWIDDIKITGAVVSQISPVPDTKPATPPRDGSCPATCNQAMGDHGTVASLVLHDANQDGLIERGERLALDASGSSLPGGCVGGVAQYRFLRNGAVVQDWSTNNTFIDSPVVDTNYTVLVRCSADFQCTGTTGATLPARIYTGEGADILINMTQPTPTSAVVNLIARPQVTSVSGYDLFRGFLGGPPSDGDPRLTTLACLQADIPQPAVGSPVASALDPDIPPLNQGLYYLVAHNDNAPGSLESLGCSSPGLCNGDGWCDGGTKGGLLCSTNADCPGGTCVTKSVCRVAGAGACGLGGAGKCFSGTDCILDSTCFWTSCSADANCGAGGECIVRPPVCLTDAGIADSGGCGTHLICSGPRAGRLCRTATECLGCQSAGPGACGLGGAGKCFDGTACATDAACVGTSCSVNSNCGGGGICTGSCPAIAATITTPGQYCLLGPAPSPSAPYSGCAPAGDPRRVVRQSPVPCP